MINSRYARKRSTSLSRVPENFMHSTEKIRREMERNGYRNISNVDVMEKLSYIIEKEMGRIGSDMREMLKDQESPWQKRRRR